MRELELFRDKMRLKVKDRMQASLDGSFGEHFLTSFAGIIGAVHSRVPGNGSRRTARYRPGRQQYG
jgi:hypothetical protein